jgi:hypothetical protein
VIEEKETAIKHSDNLGENFQIDSTETANIWNEYVNNSESPDMKKQT